MIYETTFGYSYSYGRDGSGCCGWRFCSDRGAFRKSECQHPRGRQPQGEHPGAPAAGANSFTEAQAKSRIEGAGYSNVSGLMKDKDGIWKGKASKGGATVDVGLDYQGNVSALSNLRP